MTKIVRTPSKVTGGITAAEKILLNEHTEMWKKRILRTETIELDKIYNAIKGLYNISGLKTPRIIVVPSPLVMKFAYGAAAAIWQKTNSINATRAAIHVATRDATRAATIAATGTATDVATRAATNAATVAATYAATNAATVAAINAATYDATGTATDVATRAATYDATVAATDDATDVATYAATIAATYAATVAATNAVTRATTDTLIQGAIQACYNLAGNLGIKYSEKWYDSYQGGAYWASYDCYLTAMRDILGLKLKEYDAYHYWEQAAIHGCFRVMHEEFCLITDFPEILKIDDQNRPHCSDGPSHRWRDGFSLYYWHGTKIPDKWITDPKSLTPTIAITWSNIEQRRVACEILGWAKILSHLNAKTIDMNDDPEIGVLLEVDLPDVGKEKFLQVLCGTKRTFALPVPPEMKTALEAQAWTWGMTEKEFMKPETRT